MTYCETGERHIAYLISTIVLVHAVLKAYLFIVVTARRASCSELLLLCRGEGAVCTTDLQTKF
jgi:hypothetical protein